MDSIVTLLTNLFLLVFLWGLNLGQGMSYTLAQILAPFRRWGTILAAVALNAVLVPLFYWGLTRVVPMDPSYATGFLLVGMASAAPFAIKGAVIERGNVPLGIALVVLLGALNVVAIPIWMSLLLPQATVDAAQIAATLAVLVLLPLAVGLFIRSRYPPRAQELAPGAARVSNVALVLLVALMVVSNLKSVLSLFGSWVIAAALGAIAVSMLLGYLIGGDLPSRRAVSTVTGMRTVGPALAIAATAFPGNVPTAVAVVALGIVNLLPLVVAAEWGRRAGGAQAAAAPGEAAATAAEVEAEPQAERRP